METELAELIWWSGWATILLSVVAIRTALQCLNKQCLQWDKKSNVKTVRVTIYYQEGKKCLLVTVVNPKKKKNILSLGRIGQTNIATSAKNVIRQDREKDITKERK